MPFRVELSDLENYIASNTIMSRQSSRPLGQIRIDMITDPNANTISFAVFVGGVEEGRLNSLEDAVNIFNEIELIFESDLQELRDRIEILNRPTA